MNLTENSEEIIIRHTPVREWIIGGILTFLAGALFLWVIHTLFSSPRVSASTFDEWLPILFVAAIYLAIVVDVKNIRAPHITLTISQKTKAVEVVFRRFYGNERKRFYFTQVRKFKSYQGKIKFSAKYFLALVLENGKVIEFKIPVADEKLNTTRFIKKLNKFIKTESH